MSCARGSWNSVSSGRGRGRGRGGMSRETHTRNEEENSPLSDSHESVQSRPVVQEEQEVGSGSHIPDPSIPKIWIIPEEMSSNPAVLDTIVHFMTTNYHGAWRSYHQASEAAREHWWRLFSNKYDWEPHFTMKIKRMHGTRASGWLSKNLGRARKFDTKPDWISVADWATLKEYWSTASFKKKSVAGSKNRNSDAAKQSQYRGGRIPVSAHTKKLAQRLKRKPLRIEVFEKVFVPKQGDPLLRVVETRKKYNELKSQVESEGKSYDKDDTELFCKVVPQYRGRRYGTGCEAMNLADSDGSSGAGGLSQQDIDAIVQEKVEARFAEQAVAQEHWRRQYEQQFQSQMANLSGVVMSYMENLRRSNPSIPLPAFSFSTPNPNTSNGQLGGDSTDIAMEESFADLDGNPVV